MDIKFKELRSYISRIDRVSICRKESLCYENFRFITEVPTEYDEWYVYGIGMIDSEFPVEAWMPESELEGRRMGNGLFMAKCIEIMVAEQPRSALA